MCMGVPRRCTDIHVGGGGGWCVCGRKIIHTCVVMQTHRQTDRQTDRQRDRETDRERGRGRGREGDGEGTPTAQCRPVSQSGVEWVGIMMCSLTQHTYTVCTGEGGGGVSFLYNKTTRQKEDTDRRSDRRTEYTLTPLPPSLPPSLPSPPARPYKYIYLHVVNIHSVTPLTLVD